MVRAVMKRALVMFALCSVSGCDRGGTPAPVDPTTQARLEALAASENQDRQEVHALGAQADAIREAARRVVGTYREAESAFDAAKHNYDRAAMESDRASETYVRAETSYRAAEAGYRRAATILLLAAAADAVGQQLCDGAMSTREYRAQLEREGVDLRGMDIDHSLAHAAGGANHPLNYEPLESSLNRGYGASVVQKVLDMPLPTLRGILVSGAMRLQCAGDPRAFGR